MMQDVDYQIFFDTVENELILKNKVKDSEYLKEVTSYIRAIDLWDKKMDHPVDAVLVDVADHLLKSVLAAIEIDDSNDEPPAELLF